MTCAEFGDRLDAMLEGALPPAEQARAETHASGCPVCQELYTEVRALREVAATMPVAPPAGLTDAVLARTSGPACAQAEHRLADLVDGALTGLDRELVEAHVAGCAGCAALRVAFERLAHDLPAFAELPAGPGLADAVLRQTHPPDSPLATAWTGIARQAGRLFRRPRIAWEIGYAAAVVAWLALGASWSPLRATPVQAVTLIQQGASETREASADLAAAFGRGVTTLTERTVGDATTGANLVVRTLAGLSARSRQATDAAPDLTTHWRQLVAAVESRDLFAGVDAVRALGWDAGTVLIRFLLPPATDSGTPPE